MLGEIIVITGPMFSGKSHTFHRFLSDAKFKGMNVRAFYADLDGIVPKSRVGSEATESVPLSTKLKDPFEYIEALTGEKHSMDDFNPLEKKLRNMVIGIDEFQFFPLDLVQAIKFSAMNHGCNFILSGLNKSAGFVTYRAMKEAFALADDIIMCQGICNNCHQRASRTKRMDNRKEDIIIGSDGYAIYCSDCWEDESWKKYKKLTASKD